MILEPDLQFITPIDADPGELLMFELRSHRAFGLVLAKEPSKSLVGLLRSDEALDPKPPFAFDLDLRYGGRKECVTFGKDWVLELRPGVESVPGNRSEWMTPGVVYAASTGLTMVFASRNERQFRDIYTFDLQSSQLAENTDAGIPHLSWRIWRRPEDRNLQGREPLIDFNGVSAAR